MSWPTAERWAERYRTIVHLRWKQRLGPVGIADRVGLAPSTVYAVLTRCRLSRLAQPDRVTGEPIRRYQHDHPSQPIPLTARYVAARTADVGRPWSDARLRTVHAARMSALGSAVKRKRIAYNRAATSSSRPVGDPVHRGLRHGEAVGLRWEDVDLAAGSARTSQQIVHLGWATEIGEPKSRQRRENCDPVRRHGCRSASLADSAGRRSAAVGRPVARHPARPGGRQVNSTRTGMKIK